MSRRRSVIGLLALTLAGCAEGRSTQEPHVTTSENDASMSENDASMSKNDASMSKNDASMSKNDASMSENDASTSTDDATLVVAYTGSGAVRGKSSTKTLNIGHQFHVTDDGIVITQLGIWDEKGDGLTKAHTVALFKLDGAGENANVKSMLGSVTFTAGEGELDEGFRFKSLSSGIELEKDGYYAVIAYGMNDDDPYGDGGGGPSTSTGVEHLSFSPYQFVSSETIVDKIEDYPTGGDDSDLCSASFRYTTTSAVAYTSSGAVRGLHAEDTVNIGQQFHVTGEGIVLNELGIWDEKGDGLTNAHTVKLFKLDQLGANALATPIENASVEVPEGEVAELVEGFRFEKLTEGIPLDSGYYAVIAYGMDDEDPYGDGGDVPATSTGVEHGSFSPYQFVSSETLYPTGGDDNDLCSASFRYETTSAVAYTSSGAVRGLHADDTVNIGQQFYVTENIQLRELGVWDEGGDGLTDEHMVALFELDGAGKGATATKMITSVSVPTGTSDADLVEGFRFKEVSYEQGIQLEANHYYAVIAYGMDDEDPYGDGGNVPATSTGVEHLSFSPYQFMTGEISSTGYPTGGDNNDLCSASFRYETTSPPLRILPMGDSITWGEEGESQAGYRGKLYELLTKANYVFQFVGTSKENPGDLPLDQRAHEGHPGWMIAGGTWSDGGTKFGLTEYVDTWLGSNGVTPDVILLMIGTNDINLGYEVDTMGDRLDYLITKLIELEPNARIIVAQITPNTDSDEDEEVIKYNEKVEFIVNEHGDNVQLVNMYADLDTTNDMSDSVHPNESGYDKMAKVWFDALVPLFKETP